MEYALQLVSDGVLGIGLLPGRAQALGWRGGDYSGIGYLPGEQPALQLPTILKRGTDEACFGMASAAAPVAQNHPSPEPALALYWPDALNSFQELSDKLMALDIAGKLEPRLRAFSKCRVRVVLRPTEAYAEIARMLWHPVSLHNEVQAYERAYDLLQKMGVNTGSAPDSPDVIRAEVDDLVSGDFPVFTAIACKGEIEGPRGIRWRNFGDLIETALKRWRNTNLKFERQVMRAAMVSAYLRQR